MADGLLVPSMGVWAGMISWGPINIQTFFEVFPSRGSWSMLIGKPLLEQVRAIQDYSSDTILLLHGDMLHWISNFTSYRPLPLPCLPSAICFPSSSTFSHPVPQALSIQQTNNDNNDKNNLDIPSVTPPINVHNAALSTNTSLNQLPQDSIIEEDPTPILEVNNAEQTNIIGEVPDLQSIALPDNIFTRLEERGPFWPARVEVIVNVVWYGDHLTGEQRNQARALVAEFTDMFALSVWEVKPVYFIKFCLQIPNNTTFSKKVHQRPLTKPQ